MRSTFFPHSGSNVYGVRILAALAALALFVAAVPSTASADPPTRITVVAVFNPIAYGDNAYVNGQLFGDAQAGQLVALEQSAPPFTEWTAVAQTTADAVGYYSFKLRPAQTLEYRTSSQGTASERAVQVSVAPRIRLAAGAAGRTSIRFKGTIAPAFADQSIEIQRQLAGGGWTRVTKARLRGGKTFSGRIRAHGPVRLRAFFPSNGVLLSGASNVVSATPGAGASTASASACRAPSITRITTRPSPPVAGRSATLRVAASMPGGRLYAIDVLWGENDKRDHFTLAPAFRKDKVVFELRHRYARAGDYTLRVKVFGKAGTCRRSRTKQPSLHVVAPIAR